LAHYGGMNYRALSYLPKPGSNPPCFSGVKNPKPRNLEWPTSPHRLKAIVTAFMDGKGECDFTGVKVRVAVFWQWRRIHQC